MYCPTLSLVSKRQFFIIIISQSFKTIMLNKLLLKQDVGISKLFDKHPHIIS
jgi:hypothetical protein